jgi:rhamnosyltransferase
MIDLTRSTAAIVVIFQPMSNPQVILDRLVGRVGLTIMVDNSAVGHPSICEIPERDDLIRFDNFNCGGLAGAYNLAISWVQAKHSGISQIVFVDEDSDTGVLDRFLSDPEVIGLLQTATTACVAPAYKDIATGLRGRHMQLDRFRLTYLPRVFSGVRSVAFVINSMSVWRMEALRQIGPFNEGLAIDHIDTDYCLRARAKSLTIHVQGSLEFLHAIGERRRFTVFGHEMQAGGHSPSRRFLIGRNTAWLARRYLIREPAFAFLCLSRLAYEAIGITLVEDRRGAKLWSLIRGAMVGAFTWRMA